MISIGIPGWGNMEIENIVLDLNGTIATDGKISSEVKEKVKCPAAELRGIRFSKNSPPPRRGMTKVRVAIRPFPLTLTLSPQGRGEAIHPPSRAEGYSGIFL